MILCAMMRIAVAGKPKTLQDSYPAIRIISAWVTSIMNFAG